MTILRAPDMEFHTLAAGQVLTVAPAPAGSAVVWQYPDTGSNPTSGTPMATGSGTMGPFTGPVRLAVQCRSGSVDWAVGWPSSRPAPDLSDAQVAGLQALVSKDGITRVLTKNIAGRVTTSALAADFTQHILIELEAPFDSVEIGIPNIHTAAVAGVRVRVAAHTNFPAALNNSALITPAGAWVAATFAGATSVTLPARIAAERQSMTYTDPINVQSLARSDGGTRPLLMIQIEYPSAAGQISRPQNGIGGFPTWFSGAATAGRRLFSATQAVLGVTNGTAFTNSATTETTTCVIPAIRYRTRVAGKQLLVSGDSTDEGVSVGTTLASPAVMAAFAVSTPERPVEVYSVAKHAQPPAVYQASIDDVIAAVRPTHLAYKVYSVNDVSAGGMTASQVSRVYYHTSLAVARADEYRAEVLLLEGLPCNAAFRDVDANDSVRIGINAALPGFAGGRVQVATGYAAAISGPVDADGQTTILAGASDDNVHPNVVGRNLLQPFIQGWLA